ncbi:MAG: hypothetical protein AB1646_10300 [Thermodesulfobacteriota bacterium]
MSGIVVKTVEELQVLRNHRSHPTILIEERLTNNLLVSGMLTVVSEGDRPHCQVCRLDSAGRPSPMNEVLGVLHALSTYNHFELVEGSEGKRIRIYPKITSRREGN